LNPQKDYYECSSLLEFLIISLCKNFELDMRQSVALLSNNRKYLQFICNKGVKNDFTIVKNWLEDLNKNYNLYFSPFSFFFSIKELFNTSIFFKASISLILFVSCSNISFLYLIVNNFLLQFLIL